MQYLNTIEVPGKTYNNINKFIGFYSFNKYAGLSITVTKVNAKSDTFAPVDNLKIKFQIGVILFATEYTLTL